MTVPLARGAGRFAPSPTGPLHLGNLRTAVLAWLFAAASRRRLLLRWEDLDAGRVRAGAAEQQAADLAALGIAFDGDPLLQSRRAAVYAAALESLEGRTFECFCTRAEIAAAASAPHGAPRRYPGTCRHLSVAQRDERRRRRAPALRLRADRATQEIVDVLHGCIGGPVDDIVLRRPDGVASYHLAVVVDDAATGVDQVVRGEDLLPSAIDQAHLGTLLGHPPPTYAHVPLALNKESGRLAKRDGAVTLGGLAALGVGPDRALERIAVSLRLATLGERVELATLLDRFDPARLPREPWVLNQ